MIDGSSIETNVPSPLQGSLLVPKQMNCSHIEASIFVHKKTQLHNLQIPLTCGRQHTQMPVSLSESQSLLAIGKRMYMLHEYKNEKEKNAKDLNKHFLAELYRKD